MAYPFAGFGSFLFQQSERPITGTDTGWNREPSYSKSRPLGSSRDSIVTLAVGSPTRTWEAWLTPARYATLSAMLNTMGTLTDWERPTPNSYSAFLSGIQQLEWAAGECDDSGTRKRIRARLEWVGQA